MEEKKEPFFQEREKNASHSPSPSRGESGRIPQKGNYHNDYSPRYKKSYNIYDKAREHMKQVKKGQ